MVIWVVNHAQNGNDHAMMIKAGHMRMVKHNEKWQLHNTRTKDIELLESIEFTPSLTYPEAI